MAFDLKSATPDTSLPTSGFIFGADSQSATDPSIYGVQALMTALLGSSGLNGGTVTSNTPLINLTQTWNDAGTNFVGIKLNVTNTASNLGAKLLDLQTGGTSQFSVGPGGSIYGSGGVLAFQDVCVLGSILARVDSGNLYLTTNSLLYQVSAGIIGVRGGSSSTGGALSFIEQTAPSAPSANGVYVYAEDNGSGKTRLMALFASGAAQQIAIEP